MHCCIMLQDCPGLTVRWHRKKGRRIRQWLLWRKINILFPASTGPGQLYVKSAGCNESLSGLQRTFSCYFSKAAQLCARSSLQLSSKHDKDAHRFPLEDSKKVPAGLVCLHPFKQKTYIMGFFLPHVYPSAKQSSAAEKFQWQLNSACTAPLSQSLPPWRSPSPAQCRCLLDRQEKETGREVSKMNIASITLEGKASRPKLDVRQSTSIFLTGTHMSLFSNKRGMKKISVQGQQARLSF